MRRRLGLIAGPILAILVFALLPATGDAALSTAGRATAAIGILMACWWLTEALPLPVTALLPLALFPLFDVAAIGTSARPYADSVIFLFMGGFMLGLAMERWGLHRRLALSIILAVGTAPRRLVAGFMIATAFLSMWISNTATTIILLPVAQSVVTLMLNRDDVDPRSARRFATCLTLSIAYSASIGGAGTLIGSPPNLVVASYASQQLGCQIGMLDWMRFGVPSVLLMLPLAWLYLTRIAFPFDAHAIPGGRDQVRAALHALGPMQRGEKIVAAVFSLTAVAWMLRPQLASWIGVPGLSDTGIAILAASLLFLIPVRRGVATLDWDTAARLPWGVLLLFGGGLSLAAAISTHHVDQFIAGTLGSLGQLPPLALLLAIVALVISVTELTSNTAVATTFAPILAAVALGLGGSPMLALLAIGIGANYAFMMPVATPPNAIVFASGRVTIGQMARAGLVLNLFAVIVVTALVWWAAPGVCE